MKYSIVIPTYNHCDDFLKPCIDSILQYTHIADIELIISANGCTDNTQQYLAELQDYFCSVKYPHHLKIIWNDFAIGFPKAVNAGIRASTCNKVVLLNNDTKLLPQNSNDWLIALDRQFHNNPKCGVACVVKEYSKLMKAYFAVFFCVMIDRKLFDEIGYLNEDFGTGSGEDMEFCLIAQQKGYEICEAYDKIALDEKYFGGQFPIYHFGEGTVHDTSLIPDWKSTFLRNGLKLAVKYNQDWNNVKIHNDKKIAVITPIHNDIEHISGAINCVKSQTLGNVVHYIFDDGSTDGLFEGLKEVIDNNSVKFFRGEQCGGQSNARNNLIELAIKDGCEYIAFLDSDDFWYENHLEKAINNLSDNTEIVYSTPQFVNTMGGFVFPVGITVPQMFIGKQLHHNNFIWISSVVAKIAPFKYNKFDSNLDSIEDWDMWLTLNTQGYQFKQIDGEPTVRYLARETSQASLGQQKQPLLWKKHERLDKLKLHLACGHDYTEGYINVDFYAPPDAKCDVRFDVQKLPYPDNSVDEIKAFHIIEHFHFFEIQEVLKEWYRVLKPGGRLYLETPDFLETCRSFVEGSPVMPIEDWRVLLYGHFFAHAWVPGQTHKFLFTETQLRTNLGWAGFKQVNRLPPASKYVMNETYHLFLNVEAFK
jgi:glycosyltransferase involved in cell wall biosynthesis